jgi:hypothetical protein
LPLPYLQPTHVVVLVVVSVAVLEDLAVVSVVVFH